MHGWVNNGFRLGYGTAEYLGCGTESTDTSVPPVRYSHPIYVIHLQLQVCTYSEADSHLQSPPSPPVTQQTVYLHYILDS